MECLRLTWDFILSLRHWGPDPEAEPLLQPQPDETQYPPPNTRLSPPRPRARPRLPGHHTGQSSHSSLGHLLDGPSGPGSPSVKQSLERLKQADEISRVFSGRMRSVRTSQPPTPSTGFFGSTRGARSSASTPVIPTIQPLTLSPVDHTLPAVRTSPLPTPIPFASPPRPRSRSRSPPAEVMPRSVSAPHVPEWGAHQMPAGGRGNLVVSRARPRSNTVGMNPHIEPRSGRGRSTTARGPRPTAPVPPLRSSSSIPGQLGLAEAMASGSAIESGEESEGPVIRRDLGIRGLYRGNRTRGRGRPARGRATTH